MNCSKLQLINGSQSALSSPSGFVLWHCGQPALQNVDIAQLGSLGAINQAQTQAGLDAQRETTRQAAYQPQEELDRYAGRVAGIMGGYPGQTVSTNVPNPTPLQTALGVGTTLAGIYGGIKNPGKVNYNLSN